MILDSYEVNLETLMIAPYGAATSKVYEYDGEFIVKMPPLTIIKNSCMFFGATFEGRRDATKTIIGINKKVPIVIEDSRNIIFFPISSCINRSSTWVSYQNLLNYFKVDSNRSKLFFKNNRNLCVDIKYNMIDNQFLRCLKLETLLSKRKDFSKGVNVDINVDNLT